MIRLFWWGRRRIVRSFWKANGCSLVIAWWPGRARAVARDLTGRNMTRMNGRRIRQGRLIRGDSIGVGPFELLFDSGEAITTKVLESGSGRLPLMGDSGPSEHVAGRIPGGPVHRLSSPRADAGEAGAQPVARGSDSPAGGEDRGASPNSGSPSDSKERVMSHEADSDIPDGRPGDFTDRKRLSARSRRLAEETDQLRARVAAAQQALDRRAARHRSHLADARRRLDVRLKDLKHQAQSLLSAARDKDSPLAGQAEWLVRSLDDMTVAKASGAGDRDADSQRTDPPSVSKGRADPTATEPPPVEDDGSEVIGADSSSAPGLGTRVAELVRMARAEREAIERREGKLESLHFETEQQHARMNRRQADLKRRETALETRFKSLADTLVVLHREREPLLKRLGEINAEEDSVRAQIKNCEWARQQFGEEVTELAQSSQNLAIRQRDLFDQMEQERHRIQVCRAELHKRAADLEKAALARRLAVEADVCRHHAEIEAREAELKARRESIESNARGEMESAASELEHVLSAGIGGIEAEMASHQADLEARAAELCGPGVETNGPGGDEIERSIEEPLRKMAEELNALSRLDAFSRSDAAGMDELDAAIGILTGEAADSARDRNSRPTVAPASSPRARKHERDGFGGRQDEGKRSDGAKE